MYPEIKSFDLRLKQVEDDGTFTGHAAIFGNIDAYGDVIEPGAFTKTLKERPEVPILWYHNPYEPIGLSGSLVEDDKGLKVSGHLNLDVQRARETHSLMKQRAVRGLSIGYEAIKAPIEKNVRHLREIALWEFSPVVFGANDLALIEAVKAYGLPVWLPGKGAQSAPDFPLAEREYEWDADEADGRWREETDATEEPNARYRRGFLWYDAADADTFGAYKLLIVDVIDGESRIVPRAVFAVANALVNPARRPDIPETDILAIKRTVSRLYARMREEFDDESIVAPWDQDAAPDPEVKEGRVLSSRNRTLVANAIEALQALLDAADASAEAGEPSKSHDEPDVVSTLRAFHDELKTRRSRTA